MTPASIKAAYKRALASSMGPGETVTLRRAAGTGAGDYTVAAWVTGYQPSDVAGMVQQGKRKVVVLADDVAASGFPAPFLPRQDRIVWGGKTNVITAVDDASRRVQGVLVAYDLEIAGA